MQNALTIACIGTLAACVTTQPAGEGDKLPPNPRGTAVRVAPDPAKMEEAAAASSKVVGKSAPEFVLLDMNEKTAKLSDYKGKWAVLYFYPRDDTPGCVCEATEFTDLLWRFHRLKSSIVGISPDSPESHRKFAKKYGLQVSLLSDPKKQAMRRYGAWVESTVADTTQGRVVRSTFIVDPEGNIAYHWPEVIPEGHAERVRARLVTLQIARNEALLSKVVVKPAPDEPEPEKTSGVPVTPGS